MAVEYIDACTGVAIVLGSAVAAQWHLGNKKDSDTKDREAKMVESHIADLRQARETDATHSSDFENRLIELEKGNHV